MLGSDSLLGNKLAPMASNTTQTSRADETGSHWEALVDYSASLDCIRCGLCLRTCPTYTLTGRESSSPRGRIHLMRAVGEGRLEPDAVFAEEMNFCLGCRNCESVCPAGVEFGQMMNHTRAGLEMSNTRSPKGRFLRWLGLRVLLPNRRALGLAAILARLGAQTGLMKLVTPLLGSTLPPAEDLPLVPSRKQRRPLAARTEAIGEQQEEVILLEGCLMPVYLGRVNRASVRVLSATGVAVLAPSKAGCCGAMHAHNGDSEGARKLALGLMAVYGSPTDSSGAPLPIVVNSAGCGSHMKEYAELFEPGSSDHAAATAFAKRVVDWNEYLEPRLHRLPASPPKDAIHKVLGRGDATWDAPCHLCHGQGIREEPLAILDAALEKAGIHRVPLHESESCCGSAGSYSLTHRGAANELLEGKLDNLEASGASLLVTSNPGCQLQWELGVRRRKLDVRVAHIAEVVAATLPS
jgi:glycolate oxidase iron-sulfur subunit